MKKQNGRSYQHGALIAPPTLNPTPSVTSTLYDNAGPSSKTQNVQSAMARALRSGRLEQQNSILRSPFNGAGHARPVGATETEDSR